MNYDGQPLFPNESRLGLLFLNSESITENEVDEFVFELISAFKDKYNFDSTHIEVLLDSHSWDPERLNRELKTNIEACISNSNLTMESVFKEIGSSPLKKHHKKKDKSKSKGSKENKELLDLSQQKETVNEKEGPPTQPILLDLSQQKETVNEKEGPPTPTVHPMINDLFQEKEVMMLLPPLPPDTINHSINDNEILLVNTIKDYSDESSIRRISSDGGDPIESNFAVVSIDKPSIPSAKSTNNGVIEIDEVCSICGDSMTKLLSLESAYCLPQSELANYAIGCNSGHR